MKLIFNKKRVKLLFKKSNKISKYLSPNILFYKKKIIFSCSIRYRLENKNYHKDYSEISGYFFNLNTKIKKKLFTLKPEDYYLDRQYISFMAPFIFKNKSNYYCLIQATRLHNKKREIIILETKNFTKWSESKFNLFKQNNNLFTPFYIKKDNRKYIFYSKDLKKILCSVYGNKLDRPLYEHLIIKSKLKGNTIYAPYIIKIKNHYLMFYSLWENNEFGTINILKSKNLINWSKTNFAIQSFNRDVKIISEPCIIHYNKKILLFFEAKKKNNYWNIGYKVIDKIIL